MLGSLVGVTRCSTTLFVEAHLIHSTTQEREGDGELRFHTRLWGRQRRPESRRRHAEQRHHQVDNINRFNGPGVNSGLTLTDSDSRHGVTVVSFDSRLRSRQSSDSSQASLSVSSHLQPQHRAPHHPAKGFSQSCVPVHRAHPDERPAESPRGSVCSGFRRGH